MKVNLLAVVAASLMFMTSANAFAVMQCIDNGKINHIGVGKLKGVLGCPDSGACIYFEHTDGDGVGTSSVNEVMNLNDYNVGMGMLAILKTAMLTGSKVNAWDHSYDTCESVDEIRITMD